MTVTLVSDTDETTEQVDLDSRLVSLLRPDSFAADQYRTLRYALERACPSESCRVIAVTSAVPGDGKTTTAINLAGAIANGQETRVLLIDADLRRPSVAKVLGQNGQDRGRGLIDAILDRRQTLERITWRMENFNLSVVSSRRPQVNTYELLASGRLGELIRDARQHYDYVMLDTPPVLPAPDSRLLAEWIDGYIIVVAADRTPRRLLEETLALLGPAKVLGLVFNREGFRHSRYGRYYYAYTSRP
jgi:capsular exopolysaccharide synthesis family protein